MNHPYPALTPVVSKMEPLLGLIVDADRTSTGYRYHVMISPEAWNASGRRPTDRPEIINLYDHQLTPQEKPTP